MSRGGIGKSKKQPSPSPAQRRGRSRERRPRVRVEQRPRPGLAALIGSVLLGLSSFLLVMGFALGPDGGGQSAVSFAVVTLPLGYASVAMLSQKTPVIGSTLYAFTATVVIAAVVTLGVLFFGGVVLVTSMTVGVGIGTIIAMRMPEGSTRNARFAAVGLVAIAAFAAELFAPLLSLLGPFLVVSAVYRVDMRLVVATQAASG